MENLKESIKFHKSFSKINLFLKILSKRKDGFHNIFSYLIPVNFYDEIYFEEIEKGRFELETEGAYIKKEENLVTKAGFELKKYKKNNKGIKIRILKNIPLGSGLGGGSSNCALALKFLNNYWECNLNKKEILKISAKLGSDVPFFMEGKPCFISGKGEKIIRKELNLKLPEKIVLFIPTFQTKTKDVYSVFDELHKNRPEFDKNKFLENLSYENLENDLQEAAFIVNPELKNIYNEIRKTNPEILLLSGSGSSFWGFYKNREMEEKAKRILTNSVKFYIVSFTKFLPLEGGI